MGRLVVLDVDNSRLSALHEALTAAIGELEGLGEYTAVAHVASALDAIEARLDTMPDLPRDLTGGLVTIARRMREVFGVDAEAVARRQLGAASGASLMTWAAIVNRIAG